MGRLSRASVRTVEIALLVWVAASLLIASSSGATQKVCEKDTPARGTVPDPKWKFAYSSWAEPYAVGALRYFYTFKNLTDHSVPVKWDDANIERVKTLPGEEIQSDKVDDMPSGLLESAIFVGPEGAGRRRYAPKNCLYAGSPDKRGFALIRTGGTAFRFRGRIEGATGRVVGALGVEFSSRVTRGGAPPLAGGGFDIEYAMVNSQWAKLAVSWDVPGNTKRMLVPAKNELLVWGQASFVKNPQVLRTVVRLVDGQTEEELAVFYVPVLIGKR